MIPKRIVQIWGGGSPIPLACKASSVNARLLHRDFEYLLFGDAEMSEFIAERGPQYMDLFTAIERPIQRYDFFRYFAIYELGGFYFDMDIYLAESVEDLLNLECVFPFERISWSNRLWENYGMCWEIGNYGFGARKRHPFVKAILDNCAEALGNPAANAEMLQGIPRILRQDLSVIYTSGPGLVSQTLAEYRDQENPVRVLQAGDPSIRTSWNRFGYHGVHLMNSSWRPVQSGIRRRFLNVIARRYEDRMVERAACQKTHGSNLWRGPTSGVFELVDVMPKAVSL